MRTLVLPVYIAESAPFRKQVRNASPEELTKLVLTLLGTDGIRSSPTELQGMVTIHSSGLDWMLYCVLTKRHAVNPKIELAAVSDFWCESPDLRTLVAGVLGTIGVSLYFGLGLTVIVAPVPRWY